MNHKTKQDPSRAGLGSSQPEGQGTTNREIGISKPSSGKKQKKS
ncbi:YuzL family protein [Bacillus sp. MUM 13]|nr:YuzL family protein [Bacillus sp. MUM 13]